MTNIKWFFAFLLFPTVNIIYSQSVVAIANQILANRIVKIDEVKLLSTQRPELLEDHLNKLRFLKPKTFISADNRKDQVTLTQKEGKDLIDSIRANYKKVWTEKEIKKISILKSEDTRKYMNGDNKKNTLVLISKPILIRNGEIAVVYFGNFIYIKELGYSDLCFYKKINGVWKKWIQINRING